VIFARAKGIVLHLLEIWQNILITPLARIPQQPRPIVVILALPAHVDHSVDRARSAENLSGRPDDFPLIEGWIGIRQVLPIVARIGDGLDLARRDPDDERVVARAAL
jgi:hypothetical protein